MMNILQFIEGGHEVAEKTSIIEYREGMLDTLWNKSRAAGGKEAIWRKVVMNELKL